MTEILNRKTAKRLLLINWSCFQNEIIELGSSTLFTGVNGTGKTTILDAMLYLLTANRQFNKAADDKDRNVTAYIHGDRKTNGSDRYLRKDAVTSYIAMEFFDPASQKYFVVAVCMESKNPQDAAESKWFIFDNCRFDDINFYDIEALKEKRFITTAKNNLTVKGIPIKAGDFLGRDKAIEQVKRVLGIRGDAKKFREKLLKMTAFDPERNVDKFLQDSVLADIPVHSLDLLREQKKLYEEARIMFENIKTRKTVLDQIEETTKEYEKQLKTKTLRSMMFEYQYINKNIIEIKNKNIELENLKIEKINLAKTREEAASNLEKARKLLSEAEGKNANVKAGLEKLEEERDVCSKKIIEDENSLAQLKQLQIALKSLIFVLKDFINVEEKEKSILENLAESDFTTSEKRQTFLSYGAKAKNQNILLIKDIGRKEDRLYELKEELSKTEKRIKELDANIVSFPDEAEESKRIIKAEFEKRGIQSPVRFFAELVESFTDEKWRPSIETFLGRKRYFIIVDDDACSAALNILREKRMFTTNVVLTDKIQESEIIQDSAASVLNIKNKAARKYANYLLNGIHLCETEYELHEHPKGALMMDGTLAKSYSASLMEIRKTKFCMGNDVIKIQLKQTQKDKEELLSNIDVVRESISKTEQLKRLIENINWDASDYNFDSKESLRIQTKRKNELVSQIEELRNSPDMLAAMKEIEFAQKNYDSAKTKEEKAIEYCTTNSNKINSIQKEIEYLVSDSNSRKETYTELIKENPELEAEMIAEYERQSTLRKNPIVIGEKHMKQLNVDVENAKKNLENIQLEYNKLSDLPLDNRGIEFISFYREQYRNVANVKIDEAKDKLEEQSVKLRDVFLHDFVSELKENIDKAKEEIDKINSELKRIPFGRDIYQFKMLPKGDREIFFTILDNLSALQGNPDLFSSDSVNDEKLNSDVQDFLEKILSSEDENDYSDYRNYYNYDMLIKSNSGDEITETDLSKKQGSASGGEKQTPYFIVLAASLLQFYPKNVTCARIAFIDEAFSALSKERIEQMVKFLEDNNFQVFYAAPPEKIDSIGRYIDNTVALYTDGRYTKPIEGFRQ